MPKIIPDEKILYAKSLIEQGFSLSEAASAIDLSPDHLSIRLRKLGIDPSLWRTRKTSWNRLELDEAEIIRRYNAGESVLALAKAFGVNRGVINKRLKQNGIAIRNSSESMYIRMARTPFDERRRLSSSARQAHIRNIIENSTHYSRGPGESEIADALESLGLDVLRQVPLGNGCIDITVGDVAIEIKENSGGSYDFGTERIEQLIKAGYKVLFIGFNSLDCITERLEEIVSLAEFACRHPAPLGKHWVIRCRRYQRTGAGNIYDTTIERRSNNSN